jgi:peptide/nickel transport system substrate-binding protein
VVESARAPDANNVRCRCSKAYATLVRQLDVNEAPILPRHVFRGTDPLTNPATREPVGTGPFRFVAHEPDVEIRYERNPRYFRDGLPRLDRLVLRVIPDRGNQRLALEAGEVDWLFGVPGPDRKRLEEADFRFLRSSLGSGGSNCIMTLSYNLDRPVMQDRRTRRALALAIDRRQVLERVLFGEGRVAEAPISSGIPFAHATGLPMPGHDPAAAAALLDSAGWRLPAAGGGVRWARGTEGVHDGTPLRVEFLHFPAFSDYAELLRAQLRPVGVDFVARPLEPAVFVEAVFRQRDFDMNIVSYCNMTDPEIGVRRMYVSSNIAPVPFSNSSAYRNPTVDSLFDRARSVRDEERRGEIYRRIQEILVEELPYYWLVETVSTRAHAPRCEGFREYGRFAEEASCGR